MMAALRKSLFIRLTVRSTIAFGGDVESLLVLRHLSSCDYCKSQIRPALHSAARLKAFDRQRLAPRGEARWLADSNRQGPRRRDAVRKGIDLADGFRDLAEACSALQARSCIIDGELVSSL
jgi:hypothetical protein